MSRCCRRVLARYAWAKTTPKYDSTRQYNTLQQEQDTFDTYQGKAKLVQRVVDFFVAANPCMSFRV
jgi:hypothetical protein